jgi:hypothetical protein
VHVQSTSASKTAADRERGRRMLNHPENGDAFVCEGAMFIGATKL